MLYFLQEQKAGLKAGVLTLPSWNAIKLLSSKYKMQSNYCHLTNLRAFLFIDHDLTISFFSCMSPWHCLHLLSSLNLWQLSMELSYICIKVVFLSYSCAYVIMDVIWQIQWSFFRQFAQLIPKDGLDPCPILGSLKSGMIKLPPLWSGVKATYHPNQFGSACVRHMCSRACANPSARVQSIKNRLLPG